MTPNVPESYLQARREQIILAAVSCFSKKGFHETTMQDICKTAELSPGAVYNYFGSKEAIVEACADMAQQRNEQMLSLISKNNDTVSAFKAISNAWFSTIKQEGAIVGIRFDLELWAEATRNEKVASSLRRIEIAIKEKLCEFVTQGKLEGAFNSSLDTEAVVQVLFSLVNGLEVQMTSNPSLDVNAYAAVCSAIVEGTFSSGSLQKNLENGGISA